MPDRENSITYGARWVFPVAGPPVPDGRVVVRGERIESVQGPGGPCDLNLGNVAILPGFVNAHTHLDLSGAHGRCTPSPDFTAWLRQVIAFRQQRTPEEVQQDIAAGIAACLLSGTTLVGDISSGGVSWDQLSRSPIRATVYYELIGLTRERAKQSWEGAERWLEGHPATETCQPGLSPHAPYSVRRALFQQVAQYASPLQSPLIPIAVHLAESPAEMELLQKRTGPFVEFLRELGAWDPKGLVAGPEEVMAIFAQVCFIASIHGYYLPPVMPNMPNGRLPALVQCPRTRAAFGHGQPQFVIASALGTDSLASNPDLDILAEARFALRHHRNQLGGGTTLLGYLTLGGAAVLGWAHETGSLTPGKSADLVVLPLPNRDAAEPHELIFDSDLPVQSVLFRGEWVVGAPA